MAEYPIEFPIEEARQRVAPDKLEEVLETLKEIGVLTYFVIRRDRVLVWCSDTVSDLPTLPNEQKN